MTISCYCRTIKPLTLGTCTASGDNVKVPVSNPNPVSVTFAYTTKKSKSFNNSGGGSGVTTDSLSANGSTTYTLGDQSWYADIWVAFCIYYSTSDNSYTGAFSVKRDDNASFTLYNSSYTTYTSYSDTLYTS